MAKKNSHEQKENTRQLSKRIAYRLMNYRITQFTKGAPKEHKNRA